MRLVVSFKRNRVGRCPRRTCCNVSQNEIIRFVCDREWPHDNRNTITCENDTHDLCVCVCVHLHTYAFTFVCITGGCSAQWPSNRKTALGLKISRLPLCLIFFFFFIPYNVVHITDARIAFVDGLREMSLRLPPPLHTRVSAFVFFWLPRRAVGIVVTAV